MQVKRRGLHLAVEHAFVNSISELRGAASQKPQVRISFLLKSKLSFDSRLQGCCVCRRRIGPRYSRRSKWLHGSLASSFQGDGVRPLCLWRLIWSCGMSKLAGEGVVCLDVARARSLSEELPLSCELLPCSCAFTSNHSPLGASLGSHKHSLRHLFMLCPYNKSPALQTQRNSFHEMIAVLQPLSPQVSMSLVTFARRMTIMLCFRIH